MNICSSTVVVGTIVPRQRRSVGRSPGRHASRRIASHHIAGARPDGASRVAASRMDDAREARLALALDACFSPTAIARTASSSASASDDAGAPTAAMATETTIANGV